MQVFTKYYFLCIFEFYGVFSRAFKSVKPHNLAAGLRTGIRKHQEIHMNIGSLLIRF